MKDAAPGTEDGTSSAASAASSDTADAGARAKVLYTKGAASASGFRPDHWSFDVPAVVPPTPIPAPTVPTPLVMPFSNPAMTTMSAPARPGADRMLALVGLAAVVSFAIGVAIITRPNRAAETPAATLTAPLPSLPLVAAPPRPPDAADTQDAAALMARAQELVAAGDVVAARGFYERAAELGDAHAMTAAGKTYDPTFLDEMRVRGGRGDAGKAAEWYRRARAAGDAEAEQRLQRLIARYAG